MKEIANIQVLLIDDNAGYLAVAERRLRRFGYQHITTARNAAEAREQLKQPHFEVIVSDMRMEQDDSGFEIVDLVQDLKQSSIVIILTAHDNVRDCRKALRAKRAWDYIGKGEENGSALQVLHESIQDALKYFNHWGNLHDEKWLDLNLATVQADYQGQYVAVLNKSILTSAPTREALEQQILERNLPLFLTVIKKIEPPFSQPLPAELTVFVEGPTDVQYIKTAADLLGYNDLWKRVHLDNIGNQEGDKFGGEKNLTNSFEFLKHNPKFRPHKVLFLFDQDVEKLPLDYENLYARRTGEFNKEKKGTEYFFNNILEVAYSAKFGSRTIVETVTNPHPNPIYNLTDKSGLCNWICAHRQDKTDFANFEPIFKIIQEILAR